MDAVLPETVSGILSGQRRQRGRGLPFSIRSADGQSCDVEMTSNGFVIRADKPPRLRGYADIFQGNEMVMRGLVMCTWARDGMIGYEFKRAGGRKNPAEPIDREG